MVVLVNTDAQWRGNPALWWLARACASMPPEWREMCQQVYVLHCDLCLWLAISLVGPLAAWDLWSKVEWVARIDLLSAAFNVA